MADLYDIAAPKKATNLSLNSDLLEKARGLKVNFSATLEQALSDKLKTIKKPPVSPSLSPIIKGDRLVSQGAAYITSTLVQPTFRVKLIRLVQHINQHH
ncbi:MAG: type II toxin-antitoxin system CcdA family antitoxin [Glaciecola sp.]